MSLIALFHLTTPRAVAVHCSGRRELGLVIKRLAAKPDLVVDEPQRRRDVRVDAGAGVRVTDASFVLRPIAADPAAFTVITRRRSCERSTKHNGRSEAAVGKLLDQRVAIRR